MIVSQQNEMLRMLEDDKAQALQAITALSVQLGYKTGLGIDKFANPRWMNVVFIDLPTGQVSWHIPKDSLHYFEHLPTYEQEWDGHCKEVRFNRINQLIQNGNII